MWLVTGAAGHIGNVLVRELLRRGEKVRALLLPRESRLPIEGLGVEDAEGDALDLQALWQALRGIRGVFHLAGLISIMPGENTLVQRVNVEGTRNLLEAARRMKVRRLVYTSSI